MKAKVCPNCGSDQIDENNYCPECDVVYSITTKETTPKRMGRMDQLEDRVSKLEGGDETNNAQLPREKDRPVAPGPAGPVVDEDQDEDQDQDQDQDDNELLPR